MGTLNPLRIGSAVALTMAFTNTMCAVMVYFFPDGAITFINTWTH